MAVYGKTLVSVEIGTADKIWNRTYLASYVPTDEQYECYYRAMCGFSDATVTVKRDCVPEGFNAGLLKPLDTAPTVFPQSDIETDPEDEDKRVQYKQFIQGLLEMENSRASLNFFIEKPKESSLSAAAQDKLEGFRAWVHEVLESLDMPVNTDDRQTLPTIGWIIAPSAEVARRDNGYRLISDEIIGAAWEKLLGTDHFPDLIVARRLHASRWTFQNEVSNTMYKNILTWYLVAKNAVYMDGISEWLPSIDIEINTLIAAFQTIVPHTRTHAGPRLPPKALLTEAYQSSSAESESKETDPVFGAIPADALPKPVRRSRKPTVTDIPIPFAKNILREEFKIHGIPNLPKPVIKSVLELLVVVEGLLAPAAAWPHAMEAVTEDALYSFLSALCEELKLNKSDLDLEEVERIVDRWCSSGFGFRPELWPIVSDWFGIWRAVIREKATEERVVFFLKTIELKKQPESIKITIPNRDYIVHGWLAIFMENFLVVDKLAHVQAIDLHEQSRLFCLQFTPESPWIKYFTPMAIGPYFNTRGFVTRKDGSYGRRTLGIRYRRVGEVIDPVQVQPVVQPVVQPTMTVDLGVL
jgi:hypothetical protein